MVSNLNYEGGCNPVNVTYLTGLGWKRQREIVHQYALADRRALPPSGIPLGNIQAGFQFLDNYKKELGSLSYPPDGAQTNPYPFYDRWGDSFNVTTEFVIADQGRGLATLAGLMARTSTRNQPWKPEAKLQVTGVPAWAAVGKEIQLNLRTAGLDLAPATIVWEARNQEPTLSRAFKFTPSTTGIYWIEAEAQWPDGRRAFAVTNCFVQPE
jgi:hypothetical protein